MGENIVEYGLECVGLNVIVKLTITIVTAAKDTAPAVLVSVSFVRVFAKVWFYMMSTLIWCVGRMKGFWSGRAISTYQTQKQSNVGLSHHAPVQRDTIITFEESANRHFRALKSLG